MLDEGETLALGEMLGDLLLLGLSDELGLKDGDCELDGDSLLDGEIEGLCEEEGETGTSVSPFVVYPEQGTNDSPPSAESFWNPRAGIRKLATLGNRYSWINVKCR